MLSILSEATFYIKFNDESMCKKRKYNNLQQHNNL